MLISHRPSMTVCQQVPLMVSAGRQETMFNTRVIESISKVQICIGITARMTHEATDNGHLKFCSSTLTLFCNKLFCIKSGH